MILFVIVSTPYVIFSIKSSEISVMILLVLSLALFTHTGIFGIWLLIFISVICFAEAVTLGYRAYFIAIFVILLSSYSMGVSINITYFNLKDLCKTRRFNKENNYYKYIDPTWSGKDSDKFNSLNEVLQIYFSNENSIKKIRKARYLFESIEPQKLMDLRTHLKIKKQETEGGFISKISPYFSAFSFAITFLLKLFNIYVYNFIKSDLFFNFSVMFSILAGAASFVITTKLIECRRVKMITWILEVVEEVLGGKKRD